MDRPAYLANLVRCLSEAAAEHNWEALARLDGLIDTHLPQLAAIGEWSAPEQSLLKELLNAHREAGDQCAREMCKLLEQMNEMRVSHAGWRAYAGSCDLEERQA